jgi:diguanylate cyclase (GGDEF)-like protein
VGIRPATAAGEDRATTTRPEAATSSSARGSANRRSLPAAPPAARRWLLVVAFVGLGAFAASAAAVHQELLSVGALVFVALAAVAVVVEERAIREMGEGRQAEADSLSRILRGLSRSVSPDAIVDAIVEDLGEVTAADHTVVVRLRPERQALEATLVSSRVGVPSSTTLLPLSDLEDPGTGALSTDVEAGAVPVGAEGGRERRAERGVPGGNSPALMPATRGSAAVLGAVRSLRTPRPFAPPVADVAAATRIAGRIADRVGKVYGLRNTVQVPLRADDAVVGAIVLSRRLPEAWSPASVRLLDDAAAEASAALGRAYSHRAAEARAATDALTGLPNRRYFDEFCGLLAKRRRADDAVGVVMVDIDHFKALNDTYGHPVGDQVLKAVAGALVRAVRDEDVPARFGGEEFAVLLRNPSPVVALEVGERIRAAVAGLDLAALGPPSVTVSVGVATARSADQPITALIDEADEALYRAKRSGRDRVVAA